NSRLSTDPKAGMHGLPLQFPLPCLAKRRPPPIGEWSRNDLRLDRGRFGILCAIAAADSVRADIDVDAGAAGPDGASAASASSGIYPGGRHPGPTGSWHPES